MPPGPRCAVDAPLELLHVIDRHPETATSSDRSGAIGPKRRKPCCRNSAAGRSARRAAREQGRLFLDRLRERALAAGVAVVDVRQRLGHLHETLEQAGARLFVLGRRGDQTAAGSGRPGRAVVRALERPILAVTDRFQAPRRAVMAFDGSRHPQGVEMVAGSPLFRGLPVHLLMSGSQPGCGQTIRMGQDHAGARRLRGPDALIPGDAEQVIARQAKERGIDLLVMGAYAHSPLRSLFFGSKTSDLLRSATIPTLLLR